MRWMGIDGGGTALRVVIVDDDLNKIASATSESVNPNITGHAKAQYRIQQVVQDVLAQVKVKDVDGVAIGIAGASHEHSTDWLKETLQQVLPNTLIVPSSDMEIALVGARGLREGLLLLAGTGSIAFGIAPDGRRHRIGGWGYLLGDEGSGYWIGTQALRTLTREVDGLLDPDSQLPQFLMQRLNLEQPVDIIKWRYQQANQSEVAALAPLVMQLASQSDDLANSIIEEAADYLANMAQALLKILQLHTDSIVFAGGLLTNDNLLQRQVCLRLGIHTPPLPLHSAVVGAALLAKIKGRIQC